MPAQLSKNKKGKAPVEKIHYSPVDWTTNSFALTEKMLEVLENFDGLRRTIWAGEEDPAKGRHKADAHKEIAIKVLEEVPQYTALIATDEGQKHYGNTVKARITKLQEQFVTVKERLGVTGAGLPTEEAIWTHSELMNVWKAVKETCPYWYRLRALIGNRTSVSDHAITNSQGNMDSSVFMTRGRPLEMEEVFGDEGETLDPALKLNPMPAVRYFR
ncbi:hypothetical protein MMC22_003883 [Lobaria immixta]|nr:hypothetical protein [Lobaria immixta]